MVEDEKFDDNTIVNSHLDIHSRSNRKETNSSNHDVIYNGPTFLRDSLKNTNNEVS